MHWLCTIDDNLAPLHPGYRATDNTCAFGHHPNCGGSADPSLAVATRHYRSADAAVERFCPGDARQCGEHGCAFYSARQFGGVDERGRQHALLRADRAGLRRQHRALGDGFRQPLCKPNRHPEAGCRHALPAAGHDSISTANSAMKALAETTSETGLVFQRRDRGAAAFYR